MAKFNWGFKAGVKHCYDENNKPVNPDNCRNQDEGNNEEQLVVYGGVPLWGYGGVYGRRGGWRGGKGGGRRRFSVDAENNDLHMCNFNFEGSSMDGWELD